MKMHESGERSPQKGLLPTQTLVVTSQQYEAHVSKLEATTRRDNLPLPIKAGEKVTQGGQLPLSVPTILTETAYKARQANIDAAINEEMIF